MDNKIAGNVQKVLRRDCVPETFCAQNKLAGGNQCPKIKRTMSKNKKDNVQKKDLYYFRKTIIVISIREF